MFALYGELLGDELVVSSTVTELSQVDPDRLRYFRFEAHNLASILVKLWDGDGDNVLLCRYVKL